MADSLPGVLTAADRYVAVLIAQGLTNAQIAERLSVRIHVVAARIDCILATARLSDRSEIKT